MNNSPIFITGIYRSGSTLMTRILDAHPTLAVTYETIHFMRFSYGQYDPLTKQSAEDLIDDILERIRRRHNLSFNREQVLQDIGHNINYASIYDSIMRSFFIKETEAKRWGEKTLMAWRKIPDFLEMFPQGKTILAVRDPRAVLCSFKKFTQEPYPNYLDSIFAYLDLAHAAFGYMKETSEESFFVLRYEHLIEQPEDTCRKLCGFLEIDYSPKMLNPMEFTNRHGKQWKGNSGFSIELEGIASAPKDMWKKTIEKGDLFLAETILGTEMEKLGYHTSGLSFTPETERRAMGKIASSSLLRQRYAHWLETGDGVDSYPSNPKDPKNWNKATAGMLNQ